MYIPRTVKDGVERTLPQCTHYAKKSLDRAASLGYAARGGIEVELTRVRGPRDVEREIILLPDDADVIYMMNAQGDTVDTIRYPSTTSGNATKNQ